MRSYKEFKKQALKDRVIKNAYEELGPEFEIVSLLIRKRIQKGISQAELAERIGTKQSAISRFESGDYNPTIDFLHKIANGLDSKLKVSVGAK
ncbi:transcriptional regulator [Candidatus Giovannonibacteria bacterium RIFCSPLOWO2_01_FULL_46_13]|uniref:Transcriptional regulator n=1 Tax=Candidatus Giovannonibacteria bacterium RIFCSPLOWO2_01_FULL_46_13 TaxID=1798352 RepID=A0A1F5X4L8_9BACT|nr:MAG: transcriptional regulator [Candidatus Giovannonibacteria bacterium RIFCSPLOWO2_01_FULL_46_13]